MLSFLAGGVQSIGCRRLKWATNRSFTEEGRVPFDAGAGFGLEDARACTITLACSSTLTGILAERSFDIALVAPPLGDRPKQPAVGRKKRAEVIFGQVHASEYALENVVQGAAVWLF